MKRHAALPDREDLERIRGVVAGLVEKHIAEPATDHGAHDAVEQQVLDVAAGPAGGGVLGQARAAHGEEQEQGEADQVGQAVPVDRDRQADFREVERDRVELGMNEHAEMIRATLSEAASRTPPYSSRKSLASEAVMPINRRSRNITEGVARAPNARCSTPWYEGGDFAKPMIGVANGHSTSRPATPACRSSPTPPSRHRGGRRQLAVFGTPTISDGMAMGTEGMVQPGVARGDRRRIETCVGGQWMDGVLVIGGCDRTCPAADGHPARQRAGDLRLRRHHPPRPLPGQGPEHRQRVRGGRPVHRRHRASTTRQIERRHPGLGLVRRHVHRQHHELGDRGVSA